MPKHILILEDEPLLAIFVEGCLEDLGYAFSTAQERTSAIRMSTHGSFDAALLDVNLWGQTSTDIAAILRERGIPFLIMSGYDLEDVQKNYGEVPILSKPFDTSNLELSLAKLLGAITNP